MSLVCCAPSEIAELSPEVAVDTARDAQAYIRPDAADGQRLDLLIEGLHCGGCVARIEAALNRDPAVRHARVNLTNRRLALAWQGGPDHADALLARIEQLGYRALPFDPELLAASESEVETELLRCLAVAGFAAANVMLLSVAVWAGHFSGMGEATRGLLHWFSALIALPAIAYAGRPFFRSALAVLRHGRSNMDVPISLGVSLAAGVSLLETVRLGPHAYFDSGVTLLFFLLVGRYLDQRARGKARSAATRLMALGARAATVLLPDGSTRALPPERVEPGMTVLVAAGDKLPVDGVVSVGRSELDTSLITGEVVPRAVTPGDKAFAGMTNIAAPLRLRASASGDNTLLAEIARLMGVAEQRRGRFVGLADRVARIYAPVVHLLALVTLIGWIVVAQASFTAALLIAVAVLIITCPCALGLAVPVVQVLAANRLMRQGILLKSATALERFAEVDTVVFDKTGTLTTGALRLRDDPLTPEDRARAAGMAACSNHPLARALRAATPLAPVLQDVEEIPGQGLRLVHNGEETRLGSAGFVGARDDAAHADGPLLWFRRGQAAPQRLTFADTLRPDALSVVRDLRARGLRVLLLSGDRAPTVEAVAAQLGISEAHGTCTPADKSAVLARLTAEGRKVLMVGDGLNDAPALAGAHVSLSPSSAADISQNAADAVFQGAELGPVVICLRLSRRVSGLVRQNFALAFGYNALAIPLAVAGLVTPLIAAICMSASSVLVVGNSLRLNRG